MGKFINLIDQRFGFWRVIGQEVKNYNGQTQWLCQCDCGTKKIITSNSLRTGNSTSCGCNHSPNLIGKKFGNLLVINTDHSKGRKYWMCQCDCGKTIIAPTYKLRDKTITSCGCKLLYKKYKLIKEYDNPSFEENYFNTLDELFEIPTVKLNMKKKYFYRLSILEDISVLNLAVHTVYKLMAEFHNGYTNEHIGNLTNTGIGLIVPWDELNKISNPLNDLNLPNFVDKWKELIHPNITPLAQILELWGGVDTPYNLVNLMILKLSKSNI